MKTFETLRTRPMALVLTAIGLALLFVTVLSLSFSARAEPMQGDLEVNKQVNTDKAGPGDTLTYTIHITKNTFTPAALWMTDTLPPEVDHAGGLQLLGSGSVGVTNDVLTWTVSDFGYAEVIIIYNVEISSAITSAVITNTAEVTGTGELVTSNIVSTGVSPGALDVLKTIDSASVRPGDPVAYTVYISNTGYGAVDPFTMMDDLPTELINPGTPSITGGTGASCGESGGVITCTGGLDPLEMVTVTFSADVSPTLEADTHFTNTVTVAGAGLPISDSVAAMVKTDYEYILPVIYLNYPPVPVLDPPPTLQDVYTLTWDCRGCETVADHFVIQEATDPGFTQNVQEYTTAQTFLQVNKTGIQGIFYYRVRADDGWGEGPWSNIEVAYTVLPQPTLNSIPAPGLGVHSYVVSWGCDSCAGLEDYFVLQESTDDSFSTNVLEYATVGTSLAIDKTGNFGVFYYRVRADGGWGYGPWSDVESVTIPYYDNFNDDDSGWPDEEGVMYVDSNGDSHKWRREYKSGQYRLLVEQGGPYAWFWQPGAFAPYVPPTDDYCIETSVKFQEGNMWANMGVILGSDENEGTTELYAMCLGRDNDPGLGWFIMYKENYKFPSGSNEKRCGCSCPTGEKVEGFDDYGGNVRQGTSREGWNRLRLAVRGNNVGVYIGDYYKGERKLDNLGDFSYVGVLGGDYELTPIDIRYEYFMITPNSDCNY